MACLLLWYYFPIESTNISHCSFASMQIQQTNCLHKYGTAVLQSIYSMLALQIVNYYQLCYLILAKASTALNITV